jgi:hypothetical protein
LAALIIGHHLADWTGGHTWLYVGREPGNDKGNPIWASTTAIREHRREPSMRKSWLIEASSAH